MMRLLLSVLIWIFFVGGLWFYINQRDLMQSNASYNPKQMIRQADKHVTLLLTPTFSAEKDPFALTFDNQESQGIIVRVNGERVDTKSLSLKSGVPVQISELNNILAGRNELYMEVSPPVQDSHIAQAIRVELSDEKRILLDETIWSKGGALLTGSFLFEIIDETVHDH